MPLQIECSSCGHQGTVPDHLLGKEIQCPKCRCRLVPLTQDKMENFAAKVLFAAPAEAPEKKADEVIPAHVAGPEVSFTCPFCGEAYQVSADLAGKKIACRNCHEPCKVDAPTKTAMPERKAKSSRRLKWFYIFLVVFIFFLGLVLGGFLLGRFFKS